MKKLCALLLAALLALGGRAGALTVVLPPVTGGRTDEAACGYAADLLAEEGLDVEFEVFSGSGWEEYVEYMWEHLNDDMAFSGPEALMEGLAEEGLFTSAGLLGDGIPAPHRTALLIRREVLEAYGEPVRSVEALLDLLAWRQGITGQAPMAACPRLYDRMYGGYQLMSLFLPQEGIVPLNGLFADVSPEVDLYFDLSDEAVYALPHLPVLEKVCLAMLDLVQEGLLDLYAPGADLSGYDVILADTRDFLDPLMMGNNPSLAALPLEEYALQVLYADAAPVVEERRVRYLLGAMPDAEEEAAELLRLLDTRQGYLALRYGRLGQDYLLDEEDRLSPLPESDYLRWEQRRYFARQDMEPELQAEAYPTGWAEEMALLEEAPELVCDEDAQTALNALLAAEDGQLLRLFTAQAQEVRATMESVYRNPGRYTAEAIRQWLSQDYFLTQDFDEAVDVLWGMLHIE